MTKLGKRDKMVIFEFDKLEKDKLANSGLLPSKPKTKNVKWRRGDAVAMASAFLE